MNMKGDVNAHKLHMELGELMLRYCTIERINKDLEYCYEEVKKILKNGIISVLLILVAGLTKKLCLYVSFAT